MKEALSGALVQSFPGPPRGCRHNAGGGGSRKAPVRGQSRLEQAWCWGLQAKPRPSQPPWATPFIPVKAEAPAIPALSTMISRCPCHTALGPTGQETNDAFLLPQEPTSRSSARCPWAWTTWLWMKSRSGKYRAGGAGSERGLPGWGVRGAAGECGGCCGCPSQLTGLGSAEKGAPAWHRGPLSSVSGPLNVLDSPWPWWD